MEIRGVALQKSEAFNHKIIKNGFFDEDVGLESKDAFRAFWFFSEILMLKCNREKTSSNAISVISLINNFLKHSIFSWVFEPKPSAFSDFYDHFSKLLQIN